MELVLVKMEKAIPLHLAFLFIADGVCWNSQSALSALRQKER